MQLGKEILYLSNADIEGAGLTPRDLSASVERMLKEKAAGRTVFKPKLGLYPKPGRFFQAMAGVMQDPPYAAVKWANVNHENHKRGLPSISPMILLNDSGTGVPVALMDGKWITGHRTAAITVVGAKYLARPESESIAFVACGLQARTHLLAFAAHYPVKRVVACSRRRETAEEFAREAAEQGYEVLVEMDPQAAVKEADIVVSSVPESPELKPFLEAAWLKPGAYAGMCDVGRSWKGEGMRQAMDIVATDDTEQSNAMRGYGRLTYMEPFDTDLAGLAGGSHPGRTSDEERTGLIFSGLALADVAVAGTFYERALKEGVGRILPL